MGEELQNVFEHFLNSERLEEYIDQGSCESSSYEGIMSIGENCMSVSERVSSVIRSTDTSGESGGAASTTKNNR